MPTPLLPPDVERRLAVFCDAGKTGRVTLDIKDGHVRSGEITEAFRVKSDA